MSQNCSHAYSSLCFDCIWHGISCCNCKDKWIGQILQKHNVLSGHGSSFVTQSVLLSFPQILSQLAFPNTMVINLGECRGDKGKGGGGRGGGKVESWPAWGLWCHLWMIVFWHQMTPVSLGAWCFLLWWRRIKHYVPCYPPRSHSTPAHLCKV